MTDHHYLQRARAVITAEMHGLQNVHDNLDCRFVELVELCRNCLGNRGKLVLCGVGKSGYIGQKLAATLASTGSRAVFMHPVEAMHGDLGVLDSRDLLLALSYSGETDELLVCLPAVRRLQVRIAAITGVADSRLAKIADLVVLMPVEREACPFNLAPTTTTTALLALGDALAMVLLDAQKFTIEDYARLHPAGAIGRSITLRVDDIMRRDQRFAKVMPQASVRETLLVMTKARCGSVAIVNDDGVLQGIFTDGDFRRHITSDANLLEQPIGEVMTRNPVTITSGRMAAELVCLLETCHIDDILVVDNCNRAIGIIDIQDLPRFKLM